MYGVWRKIPLLKFMILFSICIMAAAQGCGKNGTAGESLSGGRMTVSQREETAPSAGDNASQETSFRHDAGNQPGEDHTSSIKETSEQHSEKISSAGDNAPQETSLRHDAENQPGVSDENPDSRLGNTLSAGIQRLEPGAIRYLGAFRLPDSEEWEWSGEALCFHAGNRQNGSLFGTGHNHRLLVSEISIPEPVISDSVQELPTAVTIQPFSDIFGGLYRDWYTEIPRVGLEILDGRIYFCRGEHFQNDGNPASHGYASLNLANPNPKGLWTVGDDHDNYATNDYMFKIPEEWSALYAPGYSLATGRFRDGGWGGMGPSLLMINPDEMVPGKTSISAAELIRYTDVDDWSGQPRYQAKNYCEADTWTGGAWVCTDAGSAVIFCGNHGFGPNTWYGFADGTVYPIDGNGPFPEVPPYPYDQRGWWNDDIRPALMLYDPNDLAKAAIGGMKPYEMQPYAIMDISGYTYVPLKDTIMQYLGALAYDEGRQRIYIQELFADGAKPVIHVFGFEDAG